MRVLVCGGRDFWNAKVAHEAISSAVGKVIDKHNPPTIIHGGASGADALAGDWADRNGCPCIVFKADWQRHGRAAGPIRNKQMLDEGKPDIVLALPGGRGTSNMVGQARARGVHVIEVQA